MTETAASSPFLDADSGWQGIPVTARPITPSDEEILVRIYASTREEELRVVPWSPEEKAAFLRFQAQAQHTHYFKHYSQADYLILEQAGKPIGRIYVDFSNGQIHVLDIALLPEYRNQGIGTAIFKNLINRARQESLDITLYVEHNNPAQRLYSRLGFQKMEDAGINWLLAWRSQVQ